MSAEIKSAKVNNDIEFDPLLFEPPVSCSEAQLLLDDAGYVFPPDSVLDPAYYSSTPISLQCCRVHRDPRFQGFSPRQKQPQADAPEYGTDTRGRLHGSPCRAPHKRA